MAPRRDSTMAGGRASSKQPRGCDSGARCQRRGRLAQTTYAAWPGLRRSWIVRYSTRRRDRVVCGNLKRGGDLMKRIKVRALAMVVTAAAATVLAFADSAQAGNSYSQAQYQVTFSLNCNNPSAPCQNVFGLGGIWGWIALLPDGTSNAQVTECGHTVGG